ncbi:MAG TPA: prolyl oligopeptidase family serine peptidase, partial [Isosphaeraceae bacterium]|nr:prolyl oligopeptidase family serine peptidase [Isosphaeraceae bacterium]
VVLNADDAPASGLAIVADQTTTPVPPLPPLGARKVGFRFRTPAIDRPGEHPVTIKLLRGEETLDSTTIKLRVRTRDQSYKVTFVSDIDGSVQYYAVNPARPVGDPAGRSKPALFLSLHGAGVEAIGQAEAYEPKSWGHIVAPTNRRPFGFDWEDWGRLDAIEVLEHAQQRLGTDPRRTYLTGHSMGGHGTWQVGATFPDRFAAIGPSAGWISFWSYAGARRPEAPNAIQEMFLRAACPSDTLGLATNYANQGVYILHGDADDNVPVVQARTMRKRLEEFHRDLHAFEQPGAGHWWDASDEPGTDCVDWAPMFDLFARRTLPALDEVRQVDFVTANPGVSSRSSWAEVLAQVHPLRPSAIHLRLDPGLRRFRGTTDNVSRLALDLDPVPTGGPVVVELDGKGPGPTERPAGARRLRFERRGDAWHAASAPDPALKGSHRSGPFKEAFRHRFVLVFGTKGDAAENAATLAKARYDAETFWYRGNGSVDLIADTAFDPNADRDRGVILYGNAETNAAWDPLLGGSPVQVRRGSIAVGGREFQGDSLACLFLRPRPGSHRASVAAVAATGLAGMRLTANLPYFVSGAAFPDLTVLGLDDGKLAIRAAGFFGDDWGVDSGEFAWGDVKE